ncbi:T6SS immunity protein Tli4 family protein [Massilia alkalitolerans]|uniref:T6SS immunity protein Tli4 family protein n=1 Tax=Massilia alkalitolerans TaxID=286638 RepID=UPI00351D36DB
MCSLLLTSLSIGSVRKSQGTSTGGSNAGPVPTSMSQEAAMGLWDRVLSSIRLRTSPLAKPIPDRSK